jgi:shikimate 5-dehydrogenase
LIDKETALFGLFDEMAMNSNRPEQFNLLFSELGKNARYIPMNIRDDDILFTVNGLKTSQIRGVNIGEKYGDEVISLLNSKTSEVEFCGFVDGILVENGELHGFISFGEALSTLLPQKVALIGSGKYTKSLLWHKRDITIFESEIEKTAQILERFPETKVKLYDENHPIEDGYDLVLKESEIFETFKEELEKAINLVDLREFKLV